MARFQFKDLSNILRNFKVIKEIMVNNLNYFLRHRIFISLILAPYIIPSTFNHKVFLVNIIIIFFICLRVEQVN